MNKKIIKLALPIFISLFINMIVLLINAKQVGNKEVNNFYLLSLFSAFSYLVLAIHESFRATVLSSFPHSKTLEAKSKFIFSLLLLSACIFIFLCIAIAFTKNELMYFLHIQEKYKSLFIGYSLSMVGVSIISAWSTIFISLYYLTKTGQLAMWISLVSAFYNIEITMYFSNRLISSVYSIPLGILFSSVCVLMMISSQVMRLRLLTFKKIGIDRAAFILAIKHFLSSGLPVFLSYLSIFGGLFVLNSTLSKISEVAVAGYGVAYRIQTILILPAIALGIATAIYFEEGNKILKSSLILSFLIYSVIGTILYFICPYLVSYIVKDFSISSEAIKYFKIVSFSYAALGILITFMITHEQIGKGAFILIMNCFYFLFIILVSNLMMHKIKDSVVVYQSIFLANILFCFICLFILFFVKTHKRRSFYVKTNQSVA